MTTLAKTGTLHLIPVGLSEVEAQTWLPEAAQRQAGKLAHYIAENAKTARAFLKQMPLEGTLQSIDIQTLSERTDEATLKTWLAPLLAGNDIGLVSEAGCPAVADPGARAVAMAHQMGITVKPWVGPSSILLGLMASGLNGQQFAFHGYAPVKPDARKTQLRQWEQASLKQSQTQILIETPYRNAAMFESLLQALSGQTRLCLARDMTGAREWVKTLTVAQWQKSATPDLAGLPTLFLFQA